MKTLCVAALLVLIIGAPAHAQVKLAAEDPMGARPAIVLLPAKGDAKLAVTSPAWTMGGDIPLENTQYRGNVFPGLSWTKGPPETKSYAVIMQDTDFVIRGGPVLHWTLFNIPASVTAMEPGMTTQPAGSSYGPNYKGNNQAYLGPRTPPGPKHTYHIQIFALDTMIPDTAGSSLQFMMDAMKDHVLASGELTGLGEADPAAPPPAPRPAANP